MALFEMWLEKSNDMKYRACFERVSPDKGDKFTSAPFDSPYVAANLIRQEIRRVMGANDQIRIKSRIKIYDGYSINDALEDLTRT